MKIPQLVAHRGYMARYPENSLAGLQAALQAGAPYIECDVQSTADGVLVLFHDEQLLRTTGVQGSLFDLNLDQLAGISAHEPERLGLTALPTLIPTLTQLTTLLQRFPASQAMVEIKPESLAHFGRETVMRRVCQALDEVADQAIVISYDQIALTVARKHNPPFPIGWVLDGYGTVDRRAAERLCPEFLIASQRLLKPDTQLWPGDWRWMVYDITDPELALRYADAGVELVETKEIVGMLQHPLLARRRIDRVS